VNFSAREAALLVAIGRYVTEMRVVPFTDTLEAALDKVRSALSASAQRQLLAHVETLLFVGVPAHTAPPAVRRTLEEAWFEGVPLWIRYAGSRETTTRLVRIDSVIMERTETLVNAFDLNKKEPRQFKLERIEDASIERPASQAPPAFTTARQLTVRRPRGR
jgi:predicted DNA-binding transcriptional regulator YafY